MLGQTKPKLFHPQIRDFSQSLKIGKKPDSRLAFETAHLKWLCLSLHNRLLQCYILMHLELPQSHQMYMDNKQSLKNKLFSKKLCSWSGDSSLACVLCLFLAGCPTDLCFVTSKPHLITKIVLALPETHVKSCSPTASYLCCCSCLSSISVVPSYTHADFTFFSV